MCSMKKFLNYVVRTVIFILRNLNFCTKIKNLYFDFNKIVHSYFSGGSGAGKTEKCP